MVAFRISLCRISANAAAHGCKVGVRRHVSPGCLGPALQGASEVRLRYRQFVRLAAVRAFEFSLLFHDARRLCGFVSIPVGTCCPVLGQVNNSSDIRALSSGDVGPGSAGALHFKHRSLPSRLPYSACASSRTALALIPWAITALQRSQTSVTLITSSTLAPSCTPAADTGPYLKLG